MNRVTTSRCTPRLGRRRLVQAAEVEAEVVAAVADSGPDAFSDLVSELRAAGHELDGFDVVTTMPRGYAELAVSVESLLGFVVQRPGVASASLATAKAVSHSSRSGMSKDRGVVRTAPGWRLRRRLCSTRSAPGRSRLDRVPAVRAVRDRAKPADPFGAGPDAGPQQPLSAPGHLRRRRQRHIAQTVVLTGRHGPGAGRDEIPGRWLPAAPTLASCRPRAAGGRPGAATGPSARGREQDRLSLLTSGRGRAGWSR